ncbi:wall-associated receptor kinase [Salix suchowensis]|nr:wall-associated receptor kinase [Salix suchowensis]
MDRKENLVMLAAALLWMVISAETSQATHLPGCQDKCGDVSIPYPFGTRKGCYFDEYFQITCNTTVSTPPIPYLRSSNFEVLNISLDGHMRVLTYVGTDCYNKNRVRESHTESSSFLLAFPFSNTRNKFFGIGCDTIAYIDGVDIRGQTYSTGCLSMCSDIGSVTNGSCNGIGCCQIPIPGNLLEYNVSVGSFGNHTGIWEFNPCGFAFLAEEESFNFTIANLTNINVGSFGNHTGIWEFNPCGFAFLAEEESFNFTIANLTNIKRATLLPSSIDWAIGNHTCEEANKNLTGYACKANSECYDSSNGRGYLCKCSAGYIGNPYHPDGCQDVDECKDSNRNKCLKKCHNTIGNYTCPCPKGYHGDGRKDGEGCSADQLLVVKIVVVLVAVSGLLYFGHEKRKLIKLKEKYFQQNGGLMLQQRLAGREEPTSAAKIYTAEELEKATDNFDESKIIGRGGYGIVYKGIFADNTVVAIKKSRTVDNSQIEQFINEVVVLSQINHRNVVKLLGCCLETEVPLLVYECVSNGTLSSYIHDRNKAATFTWETRLRIASETAGVLSYLHSAASMPIIVNFQDVKSNNILLDENHTAKVSDFGSSRLVPLDQAQISTMVQGTLGYLDPEYMLTSQLTEKSDVYSFGVVLVELLTGKRPLSFDGPEEERSLAMLFLSALKDDRLFHILEDCILKEGNVEQVDKVARLVKTCLRVKGEERPTMKEVAMELERLRMVGKHPWTNVESNYEETEYLLGKQIDASGHGKSGESSAGYQVIGPVLLPNGGR